MTSRPAERDARSAILDAFETLLLGQGERAATVAAVAAEAGVSKGGLLYHFGSKADLVEGLAARLDELGQSDIAELRASDDPVTAFVRSSAVHDTPLDRTFVALLRLVQSGEHAPARAAIARLDDGYRALLAEHTSPDVALVIAAMSDGIYLRTAVDPHAVVEPDEVERLIAQVSRILSLD